MIITRRLKGIPRNGIEIPPQTLRWEGGTGVFTQALIDKLGQHEHFHLKLNSTVNNISQSSLQGNSPAQVGA